jgi:hypothetical protein
LLQSFEEVAQLDTEELRALFRRGRPEQRVWVIWALALRTGSVATVADTGAGDPDAGVRRTMAVMLAGHGEHELLIELARRDPSRAVRQSAMQLVTRLATQGVIDAEIVLEAARSDAGVHVAILAAIGRDAAPALVELATSFLGSDDHEVQAEAFEALLRTESPDICRRALAWLEAAPKDRARDACARMRVVLGDYAFACELARASRALREIALEALLAPTWAAVEQLIGDDVEMLVAVARDGKVEVPIEALARAALDGHATPLVRRLAIDLARLEAPSDELRPLLPLLDAHYAQWIAALSDTSEGDAAYLAQRGRARANLQRLRRELERLMRG